MIGQSLMEEIRDALDPAFRKWKLSDSDGPLGEGVIDLADDAARIAVKVVEARLKAVTE